MNVASPGWGRATSMSARGCIPVTSMKVQRHLAKSNSHSIYACNKFTRKNHTW
jgi:hypothetical protein